MAGLGPLFSKLGVNLQQCGNPKGGGAAKDDPYEEMAVAEGLLYVARHHARQHHAQGHKGGGQGIMGCLVIPLCIIDKEERIGCEAKPIAKLLYKDATVDNKEAVRLGKTHVHIN